LYNAANDFDSVVLTLQSILPILGSVASVEKDVAEEFVEGAIFSKPVSVLQHVLYFEVG